jgi:hypothetical protein
MGVVRKLSARNALRQGGNEKAMDRNIDRWPNPGELLHAALEGWVIAEISDATWPGMESVPLVEGRREQGFQSFRASRVSVSARFRRAK